MRLRFWLLMMEVTVRVFGFGSRQYLWAIRKASDALERYWPAPEEWDDSEVPF